MSDIGVASGLLYGAVSAQSCPTGVGLLNQGSPPKPEVSADAPGPSAPDTQPRPLDTVSPQLTVRAIFTGVMLGGVFSICNVYLGLKLGVVVNMSILAALLGFGFWATARGVSGRGIRPWGILENNINQTACSAGASVASAGLVHAVPAWTLMTGQTLTWHHLALWTFSVCLVGIMVAVALRRHLVVEGQLPFPVGIASAEMLREIHSRGREAVRRVVVFASGGVVAAGVYLAKVYQLIVHSWGLGFSIRGIKAESLTFAVNPALLWVGVGGLIGFRACLSVMVGCVISLGILSPALVQDGTIQLTVREPLTALPDGVVIPAALADRVAYLPGPDGALRSKGILSPDDAAALRGVSTDRTYLSAVDRLVTASRDVAGHVTYRDLQAWLLWPGVALMVAASLTSLAFSWRSIVATVPGVRSREGDAAVPLGTVSRSWFVLGVTLALVLSAVLQVSLFDVVIWAAALGVLLAFGLALVAARVSGETGMTPVGSMGKVSQLIFGVVMPQQPVPNLMAANVAGGAASQCADLLHDLKCGHLLGAAPRSQALAQLLGALAGSLVGSAAYMLLIDDPQTQLGTAEWPAAGVAVWKAVAELFQNGLEAMPPRAGMAMIAGAVAGVVLTVAEKVLPKRLRPYVLSSASIGLAFVIPAHYSISLFIGGSVALGATMGARVWSKRYLMAICAGIIAGESLTGVGLSLKEILAQSWPWGSAAT